MKLVPWGQRQGGTGPGLYRLSSALRPMMLTWGLSVPHGLYPQTRPSEDGNCWRSCVSCLPPSRLSSLQQPILLPLKGQLLSHAEPHVGDFRLNKAPLILPLRSPPHSSPNTEFPAASQGLAPRTQGEGTAGQGLRHSLLGWEVGSRPGIASCKTQTELEFQGQGRQRAEAGWRGDRGPC